MQKFLFGIDLGTTNSCISVSKLINGKPITSVIPIRGSKTTLPSCVMFDRGEVIVGEQAYTKRYLTDQVVYSSKRDIGTDKRYIINDGSDIFEVTPTDIAEHILRKLKTIAEQSYGEGNVKDVTITVPAYFSIEKRTQTKLAAEKAGWNVLAIINEPTAAALNYITDKKEPETFLVYDLGGGTFDVTLLQLMPAGEDVGFGLFKNPVTNKNFAEVISSAGNDKLGGDDLDLAALYLACQDATAEIKQKHNLKKFDLFKDLPADLKEHILLSIEQYKKRGCDGTLQYDVKYERKDLTVEVMLSIDKTTMQQALFPLYAKTKAKISECLRGNSAYPFKRIVLVGGSTKLQILRDMLSKDFPGKEIYCDLNPDESVALGAAVMSTIVTGSSNMRLTDVLPQSVGVDCISQLKNIQLAGTFKRLINRNTVLPAEAITELYTTEDNQTQATLMIYQGEDTMTANNQFIGTVVLEGLEQKKAGQVAIILKLVVDGNGLLHVSAVSGSSEIKATLNNILKPTTVDELENVNPMLRKVIQGLRTAVSNLDISSDEKDHLEQLLKMAHKDPNALNECKAKVKDLSSKSRDMRSQAVTELFSPSASKLIEGADETLYDDDNEICSEDKEDDTCPSTTNI